MAIGHSASYGAAAGILIKVAHSLYRRWEGLEPAQRERLHAAAHDVKEGALDLRGKLDRPAAERSLADANEQLASAIVGSAETDPAVSDEELAGLRADLERELARFAAGGEPRRPRAA